jgi:hypothetical protein
MADDAANGWWEINGEKSAEGFEVFIAHLERKASGPPSIDLAIKGMTINNAHWQGMCIALASNTTVEVIHLPSIECARDCCH